MKTTFFLLILLVPVIAKAQVPDTSDARVIVNTIIDRFNQKQFSEIYAMADSSFKANVPEESLTGLLASASSLGTVKKSELQGVEDGALTYRLYFEKKSLLLTVSPAGEMTYSSFGLSLYKLPFDKSRKEFPSDNPMKSNLDSIVQLAVTNYMSNKNVVGLSVGVIVDGKSKTYHFGETTKGSGKLPDKNTVYEIGSVTKTFTGYLLACAVAEGKMKLDDDIRNYLPGNYPNLQCNGAPIRLVHLSNHTSGLPRSCQLGNTDPFDPSTTFIDAMLEEILHTVAPDTLPGTRKSYSNIGVGILGLILQKVYGMSYDELLSVYITKPFGMSRTAVVLSKKEKRAAAQGYDIEGKETEYWYNRFAESAGGIRSTAYDMLLYMQQQLAEKDSAMRLSHQLTFGDRIEGTALNWGIYTTRKGDLQLAHDGGTDGFTSLCILYPELQIGIILLTNNGDHDDPAFYEIAKVIYRKLTGQM